MVKGDIYIDVDGVLFAYYGSQLQLRPYVHSFLWWCAEAFENCYWHTCWGNRFGDVLKFIYGSHIAHRFKDSNWNHSIGKMTGIDTTRLFIWVEDGLSTDEMKWLQQNGFMNNYIKVPFNGSPNALLTAKRKIQKKIQEWPETLRREMNR
jgi:hypothetical protein